MPWSVVGLQATPATIKNSNRYFIGFSLYEAIVNKSFSGQSLILLPSSTMKKITGYLLDYLVKADKRVLALAVLFVALAIFSNYHFNLNGKIFAATEFAQYS